MAAMENKLERRLLADSVEKLGFFRLLWSTQKIDLHSRSVLNDCTLGNINPTPKYGPNNQLLSFSTESADCGILLQLPKPVIRFACGFRQRQLFGKMLNGYNRPGAEIELVGANVR